MQKCALKKKSKNLSFTYNSETKKYIRIILKDLESKKSDHLMEISTLWKKWKYFWVERYHYNVSEGDKEHGMDFWRQVTVTF